MKIRIFLNHLKKIKILLPHFLSEAVSNFGESTILLNVEAKNISKNKWEPYKFCGREKTDIDVNDWINEAQNKGCGEILLTSIDKEGTETGFDIELLESVKKIVKKPLILSGGCGNLNHISKLKANYNNISIAVASVLHYKTLTISEIKKNFNMKSVTIIDYGMGNIKSLYNSKIFRI